MQPDWNWEIVHGSMPGSLASRGLLPSATSRTLRSPSSSSSNSTSYSPAEMVTGTPLPELMLRSSVATVTEAPVKATSRKRSLFSGTSTLPRHGEAPSRASSTGTPSTEALASMDSRTGSGASARAAGSRSSIGTVTSTTGSPGSRSSNGFVFASRSARFERSSPSSSNEVRNAVARKRTSTAASPAGISTSRSAAARRRRRPENDSNQVIAMLMVEPAGTFVRARKTPSSPPSPAATARLRPSTAMSTDRLERFTARLSSSGAGGVTASSRPPSPSLTAVPASPPSQPASASAASAAAVATARTTSRRSAPAPAGRRAAGVARPVTTGRPR